MFWIYLSITIFFDILGMSFARKAALTDKVLFVVLAVISFAFVGLFMAQMFRFKELSLGNAIWAGFSTLAAVIIGILYFQEKISFTQMLGVTAILIGIILIELFPS